MPKCIPPVVKDNGSNVSDDTNVQFKHKEETDRTGREKDSVVPSVKSAGPKEPLMKKLDVIRNDIEKMQSKLTRLTHSYMETETEIKSDSQKLIELIDAKEKKLLDKLETINHKEISQLKANIKTRETSTRMYQQQSWLIDEAWKLNSEMDIYEMYQSCESGMESVNDEDMDLKNTRTLDNIRLKKNTDQLIKTIEEFPLNGIEVKIGDEVGNENELARTTTPVLESTIDINVPGDRYGAVASDVTVLDVNGIHTLVVTDLNKSVKSFYSRDNKPCHSVLQLLSSPTCLTQLRNNQVVITVPIWNSSHIVTVEVNPDLKLLSSFQVGKSYNCITALTPSTVAAYGVYPRSVDILHMNGNKIRSLNPLINGEENLILKRPDLLRTTKEGNILVSDYHGRNIVCLTPFGHVVFNFRTLWTSLDITNIGKMLVSDSTPFVFDMVESGYAIRYILVSRNSLSYPRGLSADKTLLLYGMQHDGSGVIKVFKLKENTSRSDAAE